MPYNFAARSRLGRSTFESMQDCPVMTLRLMAADGIGTVPIPSAATGLSVITIGCLLELSFKKPQKNTLLNGVIIYKPK